MAVQIEVPYTVFDAVSPDDTADLPRYLPNKLLTNALYVGVGGDVVAVAQNGQATTFSGVPSGATVRIGVRRINATNTTATNLVALYVL